ncbi:MAG: AAA family ATPase [Candidatus Omnitrophica bacterium]|nr:AAA family ATPase [Candidatus Omnitrophota bacterium]
MYFKKLELLGFKSFCDKTTLHFEPGITAVVGPNGCGKSNIFDSIRWVLGEQSAKSLRGSEMLDVIFNGTDNKEPLGMAEVTLTFDNQARFFNFDNDEVAITRRLFRSGESEYLLNKSQVRLKDILDLLLGTGIGAESYSIIAQGKIDLVLSSRPEDRRLVFDEASGITKYKAQKREATRRLEETEQNLLRVNDIVIEVKRQIGSLERQANRARKYREIFEELKNKEVEQGVLTKRELLTQKDKVISQLKELQLREEGLLKVIHEQEAKIASRSSELKVLEENIMLVKNDLLNLESQVIRNNERINFNKEKTLELEGAKAALEGQIGEVRSKLIVDEQKLNEVRREYQGLKSIIEEKSRALTGKEEQISIHAQNIKNSLAKIVSLKKEIMDLVVRLAAARNQISEFNSQQQVFISRKKRLEIDKAKVYEEKAITEESLSKVTQEVDSVKAIVSDLLQKITAVKSDLEGEGLALSGINTEIEDLERQKLTLESHKEFLEKLKEKYLDTAETMNAVVYLDKLPTEKTSGLVIKINDFSGLTDEDKAYLPANFKLTGEAKPIELDTRKIDEKIAKILGELDVLKNTKQSKEAGIEGMNKAISSLQQELRAQEIYLANKETSRSTILEQFNKIKEEEDIIILELNDTQKELSVLEANILTAQGSLSELNNSQRLAEDSILQEEDSVTLNNKSREELLVAITQVKTELESLHKRVISDEETLNILEDTFSRDKENLKNTEKQIEDSIQKIASFKEETGDCELKIREHNKDIEAKSGLLKDAQSRYAQVSEGTGDVTAKIEADRLELDNLKDKLYELQMLDKDIDYKYAGIKERMLQAYKIDLEGIESIPEGIDVNALVQEIAELKKKLDSCGTVNLVAIEEYDELKKRYDFLIQQQTDLMTAKESLHQAILKINRTTKQMFMETFQKVREEFRNYFRLLFNGGDAQVYLIDEQDPLESGIEIICRPPGKKLQNVLLLSGGEKSMSAIALIFAIFKVKPSPFCILDEIDAALDEANVDRFSRVLQEFAKGSQFIVITHNKKTIINANVMYGITMENSGISKIVSVKFAHDKKEDAAEVKDEAVAV